MIIISLICSSYIQGVFIVHLQVFLVGIAAMQCADSFISLVVLDNIY